MNSFVLLELITINIERTDMKYIKTFVFAALTLTAACAGGSASLNTAKSEPATVSHAGTTNTASSSANAVSYATPASARNQVDDLKTQLASQKVTLDQATDAQTAPVNFDRKVIRNADLSLEADSPESALQKITAIAESKGGFVVESQENSSDVKTTEHDVVTMSIRVPAAKFNEALEEIRKTATRVIVENVKGEDVTEEFIDIEARLKTQKALEAQFIEIMKRASSVPEALNVQRELAEVRGEIEKIEGRKRFLENQSSLSTIKIRLQTPTAFAANSTGFFYKLAQSFTVGFEFALNVVLGLVTFFVAIIPFAVIFGLPAFFIVRYFWRRQNRPQSFSDIAKEELGTE